MTADREGDCLGMLVDGNTWPITLVVFLGIWIVTVVGDMEALLRRFALSW